MAFVRPRIPIVRHFSWVDLTLFGGLFLFIYALVGVAHEWTEPFRPKIEIDLGFFSLIKYCILSLVRVFSAYAISLLLTFSYGYIAAKSRVAEYFMIPLLDILQSVPVTAFMPGLVLAFVFLFPKTNFGLELAAIFMIFTGQGWNMIFSFYSSVKNVPNELNEICRLFRLSDWQRFKKVELPISMNGLLWNSMLSMAGGWFFVMTIESFTLGEKDFRLPGIGSYMAVAYEKQDLWAVFFGISAMFIMIILVDRVLWAPLVVWSEKYRYDLDFRSRSRSVVLDLLKRSELPRYLHEWEQNSLKKVVNVIQSFPKIKISNPISKIRPGRWLFFIRTLSILSCLCLAHLGMKGIYTLLGTNPLTSWMYHLRDTLFTFLRVVASVILGSLWTIPVGVFIGTHPVWTRRLQPVVQVVASFPAPMLFPMIIYVMLKLHIGMEMGSVILMLFASQWYILFNVISGASLIPSHWMDVAKIFHVSGYHYWKSFILPAIFPSLVNAWITAAGGAWNASVVSEIVTYQGQELVATGIGSSITRAAQLGNYPALAGGIAAMVITVVVLNRFLWSHLYRLSETRFRLEVL